MAWPNGCQRRNRIWPAPAAVPPPTMSTLKAGVPAGTRKKKCWAWAMSIVPLIDCAKSGPLKS
jgi:hypothetical protein